MTNEQLYLAIGMPVLFNAALTIALWANLRVMVAQRFDAINQRFDAVNQRFDDMRDLWRAELRRVEEIIDVRLTALEKHTGER